MCSEHVSQIFAICKSLSWSCKGHEPSWWNGTLQPPTRSQIGTVLHDVPCVLITVYSAETVSWICPWDLKSVRPSSSECLPWVFPKLLGWIIYIYFNSRVARVWKNQDWTICHLMNIFRTLSQTTVAPTPSGHGTSATLCDLRSSSFSFSSSAGCRTRRRQLISRWWSTSRVWDGWQLFLTMLDTNQWNLIWTRELPLPAKVGDATLAIWIPMRVLFWQSNWYWGASSMN